MPPTRCSRTPYWQRLVEARQEQTKDDPSADQYADEFYGSRLIRSRNGTLSSKQRNELVSAVWPYSADGDKLVLLTPEHDDAGAHHATVYLDTRAAHHLLSYFQTKSTRYRHVARAGRFGGRRFRRLYVDYSHRYPPHAGLIDAFARPL